MWVLEPLGLEDDTSVSWERLAEDSWSSQKGCRKICRNSYMYICILYMHIYIYTHYIYMYIYTYIYIRILALLELRSSLDLGLQLMSRRLSRIWLSETGPPT